MNIPPTTPDEFIARCAEPFRQTLEEMRGIIRSVLPGAEEKISYQAPCFRYNNAFVVGLNTTQKFCSLLVMSPPLVKKIADELTGVKVSGATLHFPPGQPLPEELIRKVVLARVAENAARKMVDG